MALELVRIDYNNEQHGHDLVMLLNAYAIDPMGGGEPLSDYVRDNLPQSLAKQSNVFSVIGYLDGKPAGLINCVEGFSTFNCAPLVNIHDVVVLPEYRGKGLAEQLFKEVEEIAREKHCCKITLEVLEGNQVAQKAYRKFGYSGYELDPKMGQALFWEKPL